MELVPRQPIFDLYWYFAAERQAIFNRRAAGLPRPWTDDPILAEYKFCNVFRASDRESQYLIGRIIYGQDLGSIPDQLMRIVAFRLFSRGETWDAVVAYLGHQPTLADLASERFQQALSSAKATTGKLYTGAFILCAADAYGQRVKHLNHIALLRHMFLRDDLAAHLLAAPSLAAVFGLLHRYPLIGDFMAYQIAIDLNYSSHLAFSENDFTKAGPGARRGIAKAFSSIGRHTTEEVIMWMVRHQDDELAARGLTLGGPGGRKLHAIDAQGLFCELDKYCRQAAPELASNRTRIKTRFGSPRPSLEYVYPPEWGVPIRPQSARN
jgi:hypothetical protein